VNRRILIIGGTGFIGNALTNQFIKLGDEVTLFHRKMSTVTWEHIGLRHILGDRKEHGTQLSGCKFDVVIDTCGFSPDDFLILDSIVTDHYIFLSSVSVYSKYIAPFSNEYATKIGVDLSPDLKELNKHERYGFLKYQSEEFLKMKLDNCSVVRPSIVLGQNENTGRLEYISRLPKTMAKVPMNSSSKFQFIDVLDLAILISTITEMQPGDDYNIVGPSLDWKEFVSTFSEVFEIENYVPARYVSDFPFWDDYPNSGIRSLVSKHSWIAQYKFRSLTESLNMYKSNFE
jgi:2'-hydroxyisoflavone reductase